MFNAIFNSIIGSEKYADKFATLGIPPQFFGAHLIRKGAATHVATRSTACPPISSICLRANWAMPGVLNWYIKYEAAGNQFVGKCVSGRKHTSTEFAASPAYFDFSALDIEERMENEEQLSIWLKDRMPKDTKKNLKVFGLFKMCVAVISFHCKHA